MSGKKLRVLLWVAVTVLAVGIFIQPLAGQLNCSGGACTVSVTPFTIQAAQNPNLWVQDTNTSVAKIGFLDSNGNADAYTSVNFSTGEIRHFANSGGFFPTFYCNNAPCLSLTSAGAATFSSTVGSTGYQLGSNIALSSTAPTVASGFGSGAAFGTGSTSASWSLTIGTTPGTTGVVGLPTAANGWACNVYDLTSVTRGATVTSSGTTSVTITDVTAWSNNDIIAGGCVAH